MININEYLLSKSRKKYDDGKIKATNENIEQLVNDSIRDYGTGVDLNFINTSAVTDMSHLFDQTDFEGDVREWDVSNVVKMNYMFRECPHFNCDLSEWNTKEVVDMNNMFSGCNEFDGKCIENWYVSKVKYMSEMFEDCTNFNADLSNWNLLNLEHGSRMFLNCINFEGHGVEKWNTPELVGMVEMFNGCKKFDADLSNWHIPKIKFFSCFAYDTPMFKQKEKWPKILLNKY